MENWRAYDGQLQLRFNTIKINGKFFSFVYFYPGLVLNSQIFFIILNCTPPCRLMIFGFPALSFSLQTSPFLEIISAFFRFPFSHIRLTSKPPRALSPFTWPFCLEDCQRSWIRITSSILN